MRPAKQTKSMDRFGCTSSEPRFKTWSVLYHSHTLKKWVSLQNPLNISHDVTALAWRHWRDNALHNVQERTNLTRVICRREPTCQPCREREGECYTGENQRVSLTANVSAMQERTSCPPYRERECYAMMHERTNLSALPRRWVLCMREPLVSLTAKVSAMQERTTCQPYR